MAGIPITPVVAQMDGRKGEPRKRSSVRVGLQLPTDYVPKGIGNAFWNKSYCSKLTIRQHQIRRLEARKQLYRRGHQQQLLYHQQQQQMAMMQSRMVRHGAEEEEYDDGSDSEFHGCRRRVVEKSDMRQKGKAIFAFLMLPSLIVIFNSHKKMSKEESNVDLSAMRAGGFGGLGGAGGMPGFGGAAGLGGAAAGMAGHHHPGMGIGDQEVPGVSPYRNSRSPPSQLQGESSEDYARRLMSHYHRPSMHGIPGMDGKEGQEEDGDGKGGDGPGSSYIPGEEAMYPHNPFGQTEEESSGAGSQDSSHDEGLQESNEGDLHEDREEKSAAESYLRDEF